MSSNIQWPIYSTPLTFVDSGELVWVSVGGWVVVVVSKSLTLTVSSSHYLSPSA